MKLKSPPLKQLLVLKGRRKFNLSTKKVTNYWGIPNHLNYISFLDTSLANTFPTCKQKEVILSLLRHRSHNLTFVQGFVIGAKLPSWYCGGFCSQNLCYKMSEENGQMIVVILLHWRSSVDLVCSHDEQWGLWLVVPNPEIRRSGSSPDWWLGLSTTLLGDQYWYICGQCSRFCQTILWRSNWMHFCK